MYKKILVPLDGSQPAEMVVPYAKELAKSLGIELVFLHVYSPDEQAYTAIHQAYIEKVAQSINSNLEIKAQGKLVKGKADEEIIRFANECDIDLILLSTHGRSGIKRLIFGSVANKVLSMSKIPIWLVRTNISPEIIYDQLPIRILLVPLDGSEFSEAVLAHVEILVKQLGAELIEIVLIMVSDLTLIPDDYPQASMPLSWDEHITQITSYHQQISKKYLTKVKKRLQNTGLKVRSEVLIGNPPNEIIDYENRNPINLIAMSTHGHSASIHWAYGSVADKVLHRVSSPVLLVRSQ